MSYNHLPPQAYSKETLIQAYNWLRNQPPQIQELAKSTEMLISLYTKAQMYGDDYLNRNHMQTFKSELKNLANMMGDFEDEKAAKLNQQKQQSQTPAKQQSAPSQTFNAVATNPVATNPIATNPISANIIPQTSSTLPATQNNFTNALVTSPAEDQLKTQLDMKSWAMIQEVKNLCNLSTEAEALRLLITIGYNKIKSQF